MMATADGSDYCHRRFINVNMVGFCPRQSAMGTRQGNRIGGNPPSWRGIIGVGGLVLTPSNAFPPLRGNNCHIAVVIITRYLRAGCLYWRVLAVTISDCCMRLSQSRILSCVETSITLDTKDFSCCDNCTIAFSLA